MKLQNNFVVMDKEEFLINSLLGGIACQILAQTSKLNTSEWMEYLSDTANKQYQQMDPKQREEMVKAYVELSQNL